MSPILLFLTQALAQLPAIVQAANSLETVVASVKAHVDATLAAVTKMQLEHRNPTAEEWAEQDALIQQLLGTLNAPGNAAPVPDGGAEGQAAN